eukprot:scaffold3517_cov110-Isochrysis_galbana.AAC.1
MELERAHAVGRLQLLCCRINVDTQHHVVVRFTSQLHRRRQIIGGTARAAADAATRRARRCTG